MLDQRDRTLVAGGLLLVLAFLLVCLTIGLGLGLGVRAFWFMVGG